MPAGASDQTRLRDVAARWTPHLAAGGWTPIVDHFLDNYHRLGITNHEAMFIIHLMRFKWTTDMPFPRFKKIAAKMGITPTAARGHARKLEKKGLLRRVERIGSSNRFDLSELFQHLERIQVGTHGSEQDYEDLVGAPAEGMVNKESNL